MADLFLVGVASRARRESQFDASAQEHARILETKARELPDHVGVPEVAVHELIVEADLDAEERREGVFALQLQFIRVRAGLHGRADVVETELRVGGDGLGEERVGEMDCVGMFVVRVVVVLLGLELRGPVGDHRAGDHDAGGQSE
ncbi:MAG: hypothetical protein GWM90_26165 [Gemmatimonadetes bacterium]|nr:hypothetical protein [Gemmatimonadota bacterium]NIQ58374.1 hypothetical protein [Gemmatimonadota bacterium]NIU78590.1 hypothetical protein [Gammaproteobacteria bacterium]NIX47430.1 hypothetical protein [Gemmatimonadota bacterium]NIY11813.1 hypothetical protein [Gemmatimonadota bacterium]